MKNIVRVLINCFALPLLTFSIASADTPTVTSIAITPSSISNSFSAALSWNVTGGLGHDIYIACPDGVTIKSSGATFPCNTRKSISSNASDQVALTFTNVSGTNKTLQITVYPKDSDGVDYDAGAQSTTITVGTVVQPITDFTVSSSSVLSGSAVTLKWTGVDIPAANLSFDCSPGLTFYASDPSATPAPTAIVCGAPAFATDLPTSGSQSVYVKSVLTQSAVTATARILPAIMTGAYDNTHSMPTSFSVLPPIVTTQANPAVTDFTPSTFNIMSGNAVNFSWNTSGSAAANIEFDCPIGITVSSVTNGATTTLPCNVPGFLTDLQTSGTTTVYFTSTYFVPQNMQVLLLPRGSDNVYYRSGARALNTTVYPPGFAVSGTGAAMPTNTPIQKITPTSTPAVTASTPMHAPITRPLSRGMRNGQVMMLQIFLAQNMEIYPEASTTGFYGPATARAVGRFQVKYGLSSPSDPAYGSVGPKTRAKINSLVTP